jgi:hypothetical protein
MADIAIRDNSDAVFLSTILSPEEKEIIRELLTTTRPANEVIPDDISSSDLWMMLAATCKGVKGVEDAKSRLKIFLGRMLVQLQKHPELYQAHGYPNYNSFMTEGVQALFGVSRNEAFVCKKIIEELGDRLTIEEMSDMGISNLNLVANAIRQKVPDGVASDVREREITYWVDHGKTDNYATLKERLVIRGIIDEGEIDMQMLSINLQKSVRDRWMRFRKQDWVKAHAGETDSMILDALMSEAMCWEATVEREREQA